MRIIWLMAMKDLKVVAHDKVGLFFILGFPVLMGVLFGMISSSFSGGSESAKLTIAVVDFDQTEMSRKFIDSLEKSGSVTLRPFALPEGAAADDPAAPLAPEELTRRRDAAINMVRKGNLLAFISLPAGFGESAGIMWMEGPAIELGVDPSRSAESGMLQGIIMQAMGDLIGARFADPDSMRPMIEKSRQDILAAEDINPATRAILSGFMGTLDTFMGSLDDLNANLEEAGEGNAGPSMQLANIQTVDVTAPEPDDALYKRIRSSWDISFPSAILWGVLGCAAAFAITMVRERSGGTFYRLRIAPITRGHIVAGKGLACFLAVVFVNAMMVALGHALGMRPNSWALLVLGIVSMAICVVGIMMLMSVIGRSEEAVGGASWGANVIMAMFGGGMIPLAFMPPFMQTLSNFSPMKWGVLALEGAIWRGFSLTEMLLPCAILVGIGAAGVAGGVAILSRAAG